MKRIKKRYFIIYHSGTENFNYTDGGWAVKEFDTLLDMHKAKTKNPRGQMARLVTVEYNLKELNA
tara:strand:- start:57 stop:251 length:195 start_codon:yes stop_codon:yes gene_type:complete